MLQHNHAVGGRSAHLVHAAVVGVHALCCGLPALAMAAAAVSGVAAATLSFEIFTVFHNFMHGNEIWILAASGGLVLIGGLLELSARRAKRDFPWLFCVSALCFVLNLAIIAAHRGA